MLSGATRTAVYRQRLFQQVGRLAQQTRLCIVQMRRKPLFYVFNMILPCLLITLVALLGFYIPNDSGEKVSMGITTLLSMTVFLMLVTESMPPTSDVLPLVGQ